MQADLAHAASSAGYAADLGLRDPAIDPEMAPQIGLSLSGTPVAGTALTLGAAVSGAALLYDAARITAPAAALLAARMQTALARIADAESCAALWDLPEAERQTILQGWNATAQDYDRVTIPAAFEAQVARSPEAPALVFEEETLSYAALNARANQLAHVLRDMGARPGTPIGLCAARGVDLLVGALGILKAGGAYVPLDPSYPQDRIAHYIADSAAPILVAQAALAAQLPEAAAQVLELDRDPRIAAAPRTTRPPAPGPRIWPI